MNAELYIILTARPSKLKECQIKIGQGVPVAEEYLEQVQRDLGEVPIDERKRMAPIRVKYSEWDS